MSPRRRTVLRIARVAGVGVTGALAGCSGLSGPNLNPAESGIVDSKTHPFSIRTGRPTWDESDDIGRLVLVDGDERERELFESYDLPAERAEGLEAFTADLDYASERLLFVESAGPNACHDRLEVGSVRLEDGELRAEAQVLDSSADDVGCAEVITYPSALVRIAVEGTPPESTSVELTNGWDETATVSASIEGGPSA